MNHGEDITPFFERWRGRIETLMREHPLQIISWEATRRCNLRCLHCGSPTEEVNNADELTTDEIIRAFDEIARDFDMSRFRHINITGGEPFVRGDLLDIFRSISRWTFYRNIDIQTNGVFISDNPQVLKDLKPVGVTGLGISIDGFEATHDELRGIAGSWSKAVNAARLTVEAGYTVTVSFVAHAQNLPDLVPFYGFVKKNIRPRVFRAMFIDPQGRALENTEYLLSPNQTKEVIAFLKQEYERSCRSYSDESTTMVELGCGGWLGKGIEGSVRPFIFHCIAGINNLGILFDGKLGSCSNISRHFVQGDLRQDGLKDVWDNRYEQYRSLAMKKVGGCECCSEWDFCHGGPMHKRSSSGTSTDCIYATTLKQ
jgi:radical SAM protein with 4Fe4S-binding SPASM domain